MGHLVVKGQFFSLANVSLGKQGQVGQSCIQRLYPHGVHLQIWVTLERGKEGRGGEESEGWRKGRGGEEEEGWREGRGGKEGGGWEEGENEEGRGTEGGMERGKGGEEWREMKEGR